MKKIREYYSTFRFKVSDRDDDPIGALVQEASQAKATAVQLGAWETREAIWIIGIGSRNRVVGTALVSAGTVDGAAASIADIARAALKIWTATSFILTHNHPSGDANPSVDDRRITRDAVRLFRELGLQFSDHIVAGAASPETGYSTTYSFREREPSIWNP